MAIKFKNLRKRYIGRVFGRLTVIDVLTEAIGSANRRLCLVSCECGKTFKTPISSIITKNRPKRMCPKCSMKNRRDRAYNKYLGKKFGLLTINKILGMMPAPSSRHRMCKCVCQCGNTVDRDISQVISRQNNGVIQSCGCYLKVQQKVKSIGRPLQERFGRYFKQCIRQSSVRGYKFNLTMDDLITLYDKQGGKCALSGIRVVLPLCWHKKEENRCSLDRVDSSKHYEIGNVQWVYYPLNRLKNKFKEVEFFRWCAMITDYQRLKSRGID
jgi:hypothetical protein